MKIYCVDNSSVERFLTIGKEYEMKQDGFAGYEYATVISDEGNLHSFRKSRFEVRPEMEKPTLGILPRRIWERNRLVDLIDAMERRLELKQNIPTEWIEEYNERVKE